MHIITSVLLVVSSVFAYEVTSPNPNQGWTTTGPNYLHWTRVTTDPHNFTVLLTNQNTAYNQLLDSNVDGTQTSYRCSKPSGGWPSGSNFRVNLAQDADHTNSLLAQSSEFDISAVSSNGSATSVTASSTTVSATSSVPSVSGSDTSTTPTGTSAAPLSASAQPGLFIVISSLTALFATLV